MNTVNTIESPPPPARVKYGEPVSLHQLAQLSQVAEPDLLDLMDYGVLTPVASKSGAEAFAPRYIQVLQQAEHLRADLALDGHGFALAVMLSRRIADQEEELRSLKSELRHRRADVVVSSRHKCILVLAP
ncbi:MAG: chaperone modulator CbpM [Rhodoferax sp.]